MITPLKNKQEFWSNARCFGSPRQPIRTVGAERRRRRRACAAVAPKSQYTRICMYIVALLRAIQYTIYNYNTHLYNTVLN